jgi:hypothetical protein
MTVNKYKIVRSTLDKQIDIPIEMKWDFSGRDDSVDEYEKTILEEIIGTANDFEVSRFSHDTYIRAGNEKTSINYHFFFYSGNPANIPTATINNYVSDYQAVGFTGQELYYFSKPFTKSFFKLDFYDTPEPTSQKNYFTIILPVQQGFTESTSISLSLSDVDVKIPRMRLDYIGDKEGFFIYWLRKQNYIDINQFFMSAKFFNGRTGTYTTMVNTPQFQIPSPYTFNGDDYFYYRVRLDYTNKTYRVFRPTNNFIRVGREQQPITWYEYVNPI